MILNDLRNNVKFFVVENSPQYVELALWLAQNPELGNQEFMASSKMANLLRAQGFCVEHPYLGLPTAFLAKKGFGEPIVAFLAEYDALPGVGHACGHNISGAISLLAAAALASLNIPGQVRLYGTPAEETAGAKLVMAEQGAFSGVDLAMMLHASGGYSSPNFRTLAVIGYCFTFTGRSTHAAAAPAEGRSALSGLRLFFSALDLMRPQLPSKINIHGIIKDGGQAPNVVPETAKAIFYFRGPDKKSLTQVLPTIFNCASGAAMATETTVEWTVETNFYDSFLPDAAAEEAISEIFSELGVGFINRTEPAGSSDVGEVSRKCPTIHPLFDISQGEAINLHTAHFARAAQDPKLVADAVVTGATALAYLGLKALLEKGFVDSLWADFKKANSE